MSITVPAILRLAGINSRVTKEQSTSARYGTTVTLGKPVSKPPSEMEIQQANAILQRHADAVQEQHALAVITCPSCQNTQLVKDSTHVTDHWYESPYGCTGGDNWLTNYGSDKFICNQCNSAHTLPPEWNSDSKQQQSKRRFFAKQLSSYDGKIES